MLYKLVRMRSNFPRFCIYLIRIYTFHSRYSNFYSLDGATTVVFFLFRIGFELKYYNQLLPTRYFAFIYQLILNTAVYP